MSFSKIVSTGRCVPEQVLTNADLEKIVDTSDEWIVKRSGISERRICNGEDIIELSTNAAKKALENANIAPESLDVIILATTSPQNMVPSTSCSVQKNINAVNAAAFDIFAACSGLIFTLEIADKFLKSGVYKRALVIGAEVLSRITDWEDRSTCVLFGDGASAIIVEANNDFNGIKSIDINSDGSLGDNLTCSSGLSKNPFMTFNEGKKNAIYMNGKEIYKFAISKVGESIERILYENNLKPEEIQHVICHQANKRIIDSAAKKTGIPIERFFMNLQKYGNTSSASIGIALDEMIERRLIKNGEKIIIVGFGGGLTWASALIEFNNLDN